MLKDLKNGHFWALYHNYWMIKNFPGKSGRVTVLTLSPSDFMPSFGKILGAVIRNFWPLPSRSFCLSQVLAQLKLRTKVENCNVLAGLVSTSGLQVTSSTSKTFQNAIISSQAFWFNDWFQIWHSLSIISLFLHTFSLKWESNYSGNTQPSIQQNQPQHQQHHHINFI